MADVCIRASLFGGAIFAAGLTVTPALAQEGIAHGYTGGSATVNASFASIDAYGGLAGTFETLQIARSPLGVDGVSYGLGDFAVSAYVDTTGCSFTHENGTATFPSSLVRTRMWFWALNDHSARVRWGGNRSSDSQVYMLNATVGEVVLNSTLVSGDLTFALEKGQRYLFIFTSNGTNGLAVDAWGEFSLVLGCNAADIDGNGVLNLDDIEGFVNEFLAGCP